MTAREESLEVAWCLQSVPGIGKVIAATVASRLAAHHFASSDAFVAYCGLDIGVRQSGKRSGHTGLIKQSELRTA